MAYHAGLATAQAAAMVGTPAQAIEIDVVDLEADSAGR
jgi:hypothetical protein